MKIADHWELAATGLGDGVGAKSASFPGATTGLIHTLTHVSVAAGNQANAAVPVYLFHTDAAHSIVIGQMIFNATAGPSAVDWDGIWTGWAADQTLTVGIGAIGGFGSMLGNGIGYVIKVQGYSLPVPALNRSSGIFRPRVV